jgi:hypothetical protein
MNRHDCAIGMAAREQIGLWIPARQDQAASHACRAGSIPYRMPPFDSFFAFFAARFSFMVLVGSFLVCFLLSMPLLIALLLGG